MFDLAAFMNVPRPSNAQPRAAIQRRADQKRYAAKQSHRLENIAILDMETDPFDNLHTNEKISPFLAVLYSDQFEPIVIWEQDNAAFVKATIAAIAALPGSFTIYAHNGGKFDFLFLIAGIRGSVAFKGRGIMSCNIGSHQLRDSFHIIPERLANYKKDTFDYQKLKRASRDRFKSEAIEYCINDCRFLFDLIKKFLTQHGFKISIGAAALSLIRENYRIETLTEAQDEAIRPFYFGGRVECIAGKGLFADRTFKLHDINSEYPWAMAEHLHPIGSEYIFRGGLPGSNTCFVELSAFSNSAFFMRNEQTHTSKITYGHGTFCTTIHEYRQAKELGLIDNIKIIRCVDNVNQTDFKLFVYPLYEGRAKLKELMETLTENDTIYLETKGDMLIVKLVMNNGYGKFASNPRKYKDHYLTDPYERPPSESGEWGHHPAFENEQYWIWARPTERQKFINVGTAASITGAARARLMRAIHFARNPIYCDTDSLICEELRGEEIHQSKLGAWNLEAELSEVIICGKKQYAYIKKKDGKPVVKCKGALSATYIKSDAGLWIVKQPEQRPITYDDMKLLLIGEEISNTAAGPTLTRRSTQSYITRRIRATAPSKDWENSHGITEQDRLRDWLDAS